jgi:hypothetical protein
MVSKIAYRRLVGKIHCAAGEKNLGVTFLDTTIENRDSRAKRSWRRVGWWLELWR